MESDNPSNDEHQENSPKAPDDLSGLVDDIRARDDQRQKAVNDMLKRASEAISPEEREMWLLKAREMEDIRDEFQNQFPELFPEKNASGDPDDV